MKLLIEQIHGLGEAEVNVRYDKLDDRLEKSSDTYVSMRALSTGQKTERQS